MEVEFSACSLSFMCSPVYHCPSPDRSSFLVRWAQERKYFSQEPRWELEIEDLQLESLVLSALNSEEQGPRYQEEVKILV